MEQIYFAHGNGFPSPCYRQLLDNLEKRYTCSYIDRIGHNPQYPVTENWPFLVDEILDNVRTTASQPVIGVGHSLGGVLTLLAAIREPKLFKKLILIDSPLLNRFKSSMVKFAKAAGIIDRVTPAYRTLSRRTHWDSREHLLHYLKSRPLFKTFSEACLQDYVTYGCIHNEQGYSLWFDRQIEYCIFRTIPHNLYRSEGRLQVPAALIYGDKSTVVSRFDVRYMKKHYFIKAFRMKGTHMLPMEHPAATAEKICQVLENEL